MPSSTPGEDTHMRRMTFWYKIEFWTVLFEQFFDIISKFDNTHPESESTFPLQYNIWNISILRGHYLHSGGR